MKVQTISDVLTWKKDEISGIRERISTAVGETNAGPEMKSMLSEATENPGKMLRPIMMLMAAEDYSPGQREELLWGAAAGEMLHVSSLLFDDVIDGAERRRGKPSVQARYGKSVALCVGTCLMSEAYSCLIKRGFTVLAEELLAVTRLVCDGEMLQDNNQWNTGFSEEDYVRSIERKTASVFSFSCEVASRITGHDVKTQETMGEFGEAVGCLFQIRDDILDWTADEKKLGKPTGEDFSNGVYTLPAIHTFASLRYGDELRSLAAKKGSLSKDDLKLAKDLVILSGGIEKAKAAARGYAERAKDLVGTLRSGVYTAALKMIAESFCE